MVGFLVLVLSGTDNMDDDIEAHFLLQTERSQALADRIAALEDVRDAHSDKLGELVDKFHNHRIEEITDDLEDAEVSHSSLRWGVATALLVAVETVATLIMLYFLLRHG